MRFGSRTGPTSSGLRSASSTFEYGPLLVREWPRAVLLVTGDEHSPGLRDEVAALHVELLDGADARRSQRVQPDAGDEAVVLLRQLASVVDLDPRDDVA